MTNKLVPVLALVMGSIVFSIEASAQKGFYVGAQGAPLLSVKFNTSDVHKSDMDYKAKSSYTFGIGAGYNLSDNFGIGTEVMYSREQQGYSDHNIRYDEEVNYLKIPVFASFNSNPASRVMFIAKAGPQIGIHLKSNISNASNPLLNGETKDKYKKLSVGAMVGTGVRVRLSDHFYADGGLRLDGTFTNLQNKSYRGIDSRGGKTHSVNAGLELGIKYLL